jgi:hypothetical protein
MSESSFEVKGAQYRAVKTQYVRSHSSIDMTLDELISDLKAVRNQSRASYGRFRKSDDAGAAWASGFLLHVRIEQHFKFVRVGT